MRKQYRGTVILETRRGILVNATRNGKFILPGGRTSFQEGRLQAAVRELREETGLRAFAAIELFCHEAPPHATRGFQDFHKVFYVRAPGEPVPMSEVKLVAFVGVGQTEVDGRPVSPVSVEIIRRYAEMRRAAPLLFEALDNFTPLG
ncbi:MAG TPA: NUDIX domain-containing protein [Spirochaetia bacterium]|nr:NUDIX domain-containing protein [Spirochaetia bacterium]